MLVQAKKAVTHSIQPKKSQRSSRKEISQINNQTKLLSRPDQKCCS